MRTVHIRKVYSKESHIKKPEHGYAPVYSIGDYRDHRLDVTVHMTPELRSRPTVRKALLRHEIRESKVLAKGKSTASQKERKKSVKVAHRQVRRKDPEYFKGKKGIRLYGKKFF